MSGVSEPAISEKVNYPQGDEAYFTAREGAFLIDVGAEQFRMLLAKSGVEIRSRTDKCLDPGLLSFGEVFQICCFHKIGMQISSSRRTTFMSNLRYPIQKSLTDCGGGIYADVRFIDKFIKSRYRELKRVRNSVRPITPGTQNSYILKRSGYSVYKIYVSYLNDKNINSLLIKYPNITADDVEIAKIWAFIEPPKGRRNIFA